MTAASPTLSDLRATVVIPTWNRGRDALRLVRALLERTAAGGMEIVVVDDGSDDGSTAALEALAGETPGLHYVRQANAGPAAARNRGARLARGPRVIFLDDHVLPVEGLIEGHLRVAEENGGAWILGVCPHAPPGRPRPIDRWRAQLEAGWDASAGTPGAAAAELAERVNAANLSVDRERFLALGGFHEGIRTASAEDYLLGLRAVLEGIPLVHRPDLVALHLDRVGGVSYARRQERYARATAGLPRLAPRAAASARRVRRMERVHGPARPSDSAVDRVRRAGRTLLASRPLLAVQEIAVATLEAARAPLAFLRPLYRVLVASRTTRGWRAGRGGHAAQREAAGDHALARVEAIVVNWNGWEHLEACLDALRARAPGVAVRVVDNASEDGSAANVRARFPEVALQVNRENVGFARANNQALERVTAEYALLINNDAVVEAGAVERLVDVLDRQPLTGMVSGGLLGPDGRSQHPARRFPGAARTLAEGLRLHRLLPSPIRGTWLLGHYWDESRTRPVDWVWGTFVLVRMEAWRDAGGLDESFHMYGEDMEWCHRMWRRGWEVWVEPGARVLHHGSASARKRWGEVERSLLIWDQTYRFIRRTRGTGAVLAYRLATAVALALEWGVRTVKGMEPGGHPAFAALIRHQLGLGGGPR